MMCATLFPLLHIHVSYRPQQLLLQSASVTLTAHLALPHGVEAPIKMVDATMG